MINKLPNCSIRPSSPTIPSPDESGDGIHLEDGIYLVESEYVDFSSHPIENIDECIGITRGASAVVRNCIFEGSEKIALIGGGDEEWRPVESGKWVVFENCIFRNGSRRMPEVQSNMSVLMVNCIIEDWCIPERQKSDPKKSRGFGSWAHDYGSIIAVDCEFRQTNGFWRGGWKFMLSDLLSHLGNAFNESGILGILNPFSWIPGPCRGLTASDHGKVRAVRCRKNHWWIRIQKS